MSLLVRSELNRDSLRHRILCRKSWIKRRRKKPAVIHLLPAIVVLAHGRLFLGLANHNRVGGFGNIAKGFGRAAFIEVPEADGVVVGRERSTGNFVDWPDDVRDANLVEQHPGL